MLSANAKEILFDGSYRVAFQHLFGDRSPGENHRHAFQRKESFFGFSGEPSEDSLGATLVSAFAKSLTLKVPTFFFTTEVKKAWVLVKTLEFLRGKPNPTFSKELLNGLRLETRPWLLLKEPESWVSVGFVANDPILPEWAKGRLS